MRRIAYVLVIVFILLATSVVAFAQTSPALSWGVSETPNTGAFISAAHVSRPQPMASVTKLMTVRLALQAGLNRTEMVTVRRADVTRASTTILRANDRVSVDTLLYLAMVASDNAAARILARVVDDTQFVHRMNAEAVTLGMTATRYVEPTGLLAGNVSTVEDLTRLVRATLELPQADALFHTPHYDASVVRNRRTLRIPVRNTNAWLTSDVRLSKTGFTTAAGYCLVEQLRINMRDYIIVILGAPSKDDRRVLLSVITQWVDAMSRTDPK